MSSRRACTSFLGTETPRKTIATDLGLQGPLLSPYDYLNNVTVDRNDIYVNADRADVILRVLTPRSGTLTAARIVRQQPRSLAAPPLGQGATDAPRRRWPPGAHPRVRHTALASSWGGRTPSTC